MTNLYNDRRVYDAHYNELSTVSNYLNRIKNNNYMNGAMQGHCYYDEPACKSGYRFRSPFTEIGFSEVSRISPHYLSNFRPLFIHDMEFDRPMVEILDRFHEEYTIKQSNFRPRARTLCRKSSWTCANLSDKLEYSNEYEIKPCSLSRLCPQYYCGYLPFHHNPNYQRARSLNEFRNRRYSYQPIQYNSYTHCYRCFGRIG
jgi:hypothetical protein